MLQCFGAARALPLLRRFSPVRVTPRVRREQEWTAPHHARARFQDALRDGWIALYPPARPQEIDRVVASVVGLSRTDAELLVLCRDSGQDLFTDDRLLARAAAAQGIQVYDVVDTLLMLRELGDLDAAGVRRLVLDIHLEDGRRFTERELDALGLAGLL